MSSIKIRAKLSGANTEVRILLSHPMHNGRINDPISGEVPPPHYVKQLRIERNGALLADCELSTAVSRDPYMSFRFQGGTRGDRLRVSWSDNLGRTEEQEAIL
jgi:sulfur-oxidizing protein SoxZ